MAKLPTMDDVPFAQTDPNKPIGNVNKTAIGEGVTALGQGAEKLGYDIQIGDARADAFDVASRHTDYLVGKAQLDNQYVNNPDTKAYEGDLHKLRDTTMQGLNPRAQNLLNNKIAPNATNSVIIMNDLAVAKAGQIAIQQNDERGQAVINQIVALPPGDPRRADLMASYTQTLRTLPLKPHEYDQRAGAFVKNLGQAEVQAAINSGDPVRLQKAIDQLNEARTSNTSPVTLNPKDRDAMIRTIYGEAANEPDAGKAAVANVILNRTKSGKYGGDTPTSVVMAKGQFEPWMWNDTRQRMLSLSPDDPQYKKIGGIVDSVASGETPDNTNGATHFVSPGGQAAMGRQMPAWASGQPLTIGGHNFYAPEGRVNRSNDTQFQVAGEGGQQPQPKEGNLFSFIPAQDREQLLSHAYQGQKAQIADQERMQRLQKQQRQEASDDQENAYRQKIFNNDPVQAKDIVGDPQLTREAQDRLIAVSNRANKPEPPAQISAKNTMDVIHSIHLPDGSPAKITSVDPIYQLYFDGGISSKDLEFAIKEFRQDRDTNGDPIQEQKKSFIKSVEPMIDKSNPLMGKIDQTGKQKLYEFTQDLEKGMAEDRKSGLNPRERMDPSSPRYMGKPEALQPYTKTISESLAGRTKQLSPTQQPILPAPNLPRVTPRLPGESPEEYLKRTKGPST